MGEETRTHPHVQPVEGSSNIDGMGWHNKTLYVRFRKNGPVYEYANVPRELFDDMYKSDSKGSFFHKNVRGKFRELSR